uniref:Uncharacterized protein n=1 Tax=Homalodisca liturata TaxID=320908 RepID=A0A1B6II50_9HEMI
MYYLHEEDKRYSLCCLRTNFTFLRTMCFNKSLVSFYSMLFYCASVLGSEETPKGPELFTPNDPDALFDPDAVSLVHLDDDNNVYFDVYPIRGEKNSIMYAKNGVLVVSITTPEEIKDTLEKGLWNFITSILGLTQADIEILMFPEDAGRRVFLKKGKMTQDECLSKIKDVLKPYLPSASQVPGETEPPPLLTPYEPMEIYAQNDTNQNTGPVKYYEAELPKDEKTGKRADPIPRKKLVEMKPYYGKDPSWMAKILRDLRPNKEIIFRGRLVPALPLRPILDDYRGPKKVRLTRKILQGIADGSAVQKPSSRLRFEMSQPVPAAMMLDYLSPDKQQVVSRRIVSPLFRNETVDFVEEFEYTEVV